MADDGQSRRFAVGRKSLEFNLRKCYDGNMSIEQIKKDVAAILKDGATNNNIYFSVYGVTVSPQLLSDVGDAVLDGRIKIALNTGRAMGYNPAKDRISVDTTDFSSPRTRAVVIHEAVHAISDMRGVTMMRIDDEAAAIIAHGLYLRQYDPRFADGTVPEDESGPIGDLLRTLIPLASQMLSFDRMHSKLLSELRRKIILLPGYENCNYKTIYHNGLRSV